MSVSATTSAGPAVRPARTVHDRATWWLLAILVTTLLGFRPTLTARLGVLDALHAAHGVASLGWLVLLLVQAELIRRRHRGAHRQLAVGGVLCAMILSVTTLPMLQAMTARTIADPASSRVGWFLVAMDGGLLVMFLTLFAVAVAHVRQPAVHARAMAATALIGLPPGLGRWWMQLLHVDPVAGSYLALAVGALWLAVLIWSDRRAGIRDVVYPAMLAALLVLMAASDPVARCLAASAQADPRTLGVVPGR